MSTDSTLQENRPTTTSEPKNRPQLESEEPPIEDDPPALQVIPNPQANFITPGVMFCNDPSYCTVYAADIIHFLMNSQVSYPSMIHLSIFLLTFLEASWICIYAPTTRSY